MTLKASQCLLQFQHVSLRKESDTDVKFGIEQEKRLEPKPGSGLWCRVEAWGPAAGRGTYAAAIQAILAVVFLFLVFVPDEEFDGSESQVKEQSRKERRGRHGLRL